MFDIASKPLAVSAGHLANPYRFDGSVVYSLSSLAAADSSNCSVDGEVIKYKSAVCSASTDDKTAISSLKRIVVPD